MEKIEFNNINVFLLTLLLVFLIYKLLISRKKFKNDPSLLTEVKVLINRYKLDIDKVSYKVLSTVIAFIDSFIISFVFIVAINIKNKLIALLVGFILLALLYYSLYEIYGRYLRKKGKCKNV